MSSEYNRILDDVRSLSRSEQFVLVQEILEELRERDQAEDPIQLLDARVKAIEEGKATLIEGSEALRKLKEAANS